MTTIHRPHGGSSHHDVHVNGTRLHYVSAGTTGSPVLLVHGFPESWWAFRSVIPLLAETHRVVAVDLRGFGDSAVAGDDHSSAIAAGDLHALVAHLDVGPVHVVAQDISGGSVVRFASAHPDDVLSLTGIEMGLAGYGLEAFADVANGGSWHIGALAAPGIPDLLLLGRERRLLAEWAYPSMTLVEGAVSDEDLDELARGFTRPGGWNGAAGLYRSMLAEGEEIRALPRLERPALAIGSLGGTFTADTLRQVVTGDVRAIHLDGVGHYAAQEAPDRVASALLDFLEAVDATVDAT